MNKYVLISYFFVSILEIEDKEIIMVVKIIIDWCEHNDLIQVSNEKV